MGLIEARRKFKALRSEVWRIAVANHAWRDHPDRKFTIAEIIGLIQLAPGELYDNSAPSAQLGSFMFKCRDSNGRRCELVTRFDQGPRGEMILVVSAFSEDFMKQAIIKTHHYVSHFGEAIFKNVPVLVDVGFTKKTINPKTDEFAIAGDVIMMMERELAKTWLIQKADPRNLKSDEVNAIRNLCGLNQTEFADLLRLTKGTMSKVLKGHLKLRPPMSDLCLLVLAAEIANPGAARAILGDSFTALAGKLPRAQFDLKKLA